MKYAAILLKFKLKFSLNKTDRVQSTEHIGKAGKVTLSKIRAKILRFVY